VSVHPERTRDGGTIYRVRWREAGRGTANRSRTFDHENDAVDFDRRVPRLKQTGDPALLADEMTLRQYVYADWWPNYVERRLALSTQEGHSIDLELRIVPRLGHLPLTELRAQRHRALRRRPRAGGHGAGHDRPDASRAARRDEAGGARLQPAEQPVKQIDKPSQRREREPILINVQQVEAIRGGYLRHGDLRSATLVSLLAYAGPRPESEALPLKWSAIREHTILFRATKRGVPVERATRLLDALASDLATWRSECGDPPDGAPVIPNRRGEPWADYDWDNWRDRTFRPAAGAAGLPAGDRDGPKRVRPRDLRSSFATLLIYEGQPPQYVARQLGHSAATLLRDYARVWEDFDPAQRMDAEEQIRRARSRSGVVASN
jgi:integrase